PRFKEAARDPGEDPEGRHGAREKRTDERRRWNLLDVGTRENSFVMPSAAVGHHDDLPAPPQEFASERLRGKKMAACAARGENDRAHAGCGSRRKAKISKFVSPILER